MVPLGHISLNLSEFQIFYAILFGIPENKQTVKQFYLYEGGVGTNIQNAHSQYMYTYERRHDGNTSTFCLSLSYITWGSIQ